MKNLVLVGWRSVVISVVAGVFLRVGAAETTVTEVITEVLGGHPELRVYEGALAAVRAEAVTSTRLPHPVLSTEAGQARSRNLDGSFAGEGAMWSATVKQTFEWPGRLALRKAIANEDVHLAELGLERFRQALVGRVRELALGLAGADEKARVAREVADRFRALRDVLVQRDPAGVTPLLEIRILEATELSLRRRASDAELEASAQRIELNVLRGRSAEADLALRWTQPVLGDSRPVTELLAAASTNHFTLRTRMADLAQQGFRVRLAKNERWPAISVGPAYSSVDGSTRDRFLTVGLNVPLPLWKNNASNVAAAEARQRQAEAMLEAARRDVELQVLTAARRYEARREEMGRWREESIAAFREAAELADRHYRLGAVPSTTYVELQKQYLDAVESLLDTRRDALAAAVELEQATGLGFTGQVKVGTSPAGSASGKEGRP